MKEYKTIGELIKNERIEKGLSQRELAKLIGLHNSVVARIENGEINQPNISILIKISQLFELNLADLLICYGYTYDELSEIGVTKKNTD